MATSDNKLVCGGELKLVVAFKMVILCGFIDNYIAILTSGKDNTNSLPNNRISLQQSLND